MPRWLLGGSRVVRPVVKCCLVAAAHLSDFNQGVWLIILPNN